MKIKHVYGNVLRIDIPLTIKIKTIEDGTPSEREEPFYPDATKGCIVELANNYNRKIEYKATIKDNIVHMEDNGEISIGRYKITVKCYDADGNPYRYMARDIVEICDATADAGIEAGVEFNAETYTLEGAVFVSYGTEQVQADWEEEDETAKAFIKNKPEIPVVPTNVGAFVNDVGYLTQHQDISGKVDKVEGKGLSANDYTDEEKEKLAGLENYDDTQVRQLINEEKTARQQGDNALNESVTQEETRAKGVEQNLDSKIGVNAAAIATEKARAESVEQTVQLAIDVINGKIPTQATSQNQLADKEFVNSSISTATADFKGTYNSIEGLEQVTANANDYAFVVANDAAGNTLYKRYKWVEGTGWTWEYNLNNSSFTQAQWAAIQSGITAALVTKLSDLPDNSTLNQRITQAIATALLNYYTKSEIDTVLADKEDKSNKVTSWQPTPDDTHYPSEKLVKDSIGGVDKVFVATHGVTTATEITNALTAGKFVFFLRGNRCYIYSGENASYFYFESLHDLNMSSRIAVRKSDSSWNSPASSTLENTNLKKTTIAGNEASNTYYPTTKAVADYVTEAKKQMLRELYIAADTRPDSDVNKLRYNDTGADIIRTAEWGERVVHKAGHYWMNGLGDITEEQMAIIYASRIDVATDGGDNNNARCVVTSTLRTNYPSIRSVYNIWSSGTYAANNSIEVCTFRGLSTNLRQNIVNNCSSLKAVININLDYASQNKNVFRNCPNLEELCGNNAHYSTSDLNFAESPKLTYRSVYFLFNRSQFSVAITITFNPTTYGYIMGTIEPTEQVGGTIEEWEALQTLASNRNISIASA